MKQLLIVRHAKSSWDNPADRDFDRPLNERGQRNAAEMGKRLRDSRVMPDRIISSPARRALDTAMLIAAELAYDANHIALMDSLYEARPEIWLKLILGLPRDLDSVMIVGHNPEVTEVANQLCPEPIEMMPTCGILRLSYADCERWKDLARYKPSAWEFSSPKRVKIK